MFNSDKQRKAMFASMLNGSNKFSKKLTSTEKQKLSDDLRYLKDQFELGTISQKRYMDGINELKGPIEIIVVKEEPVYEWTEEDIDDFYPSLVENKERKRKENQEYKFLYGQTKDEIDYDMNDGNVIWTAETGPTTRGQYLDMLRRIQLSSHLRENNIGFNIGKKSISRGASVRDKRVGSGLMELYI